MRREPARPRPRRQARDGPGRVRHRPARRRPADDHDAGAAGSRRDRRARPSVTAAPRRADGRGRCADRRRQQRRVTLGPTGRDAGRLAGAAADAAPAPAAAPTVAAGAAAPIEAQSTVKVDTRQAGQPGRHGRRAGHRPVDPRRGPGAAPASADERLGRRLAQLKRITSDLQRNAMSMRMVPIRQTFQKMARLVRDLSKQSGKNIELVLQGEDTELDRKVVEDINDPLMHMVRNSVDHGIESPERRAAAGKPAQATLRLQRRRTRAATSSSRSPTTAPASTPIAILRQGGRAAAWSPPGAQLPPADIHQLIFQPGFSTAEKVTEISGPRRRHGRRPPQHRGAARPHRDPDDAAARARRSRSGCR